MDILHEETASFITPPQSITDIVFNKLLPVQPSIIGRVEEAVAVSAIREVPFSPVIGDEKKKLRRLRNKTGAVVPKLKKA
ncbi:hypothetical protein BDF21DRAFT_462979 [Thamnidium elegans]|nr:hypothetical protein BDF21DRAFT_462979 [Thamnidium elegans]